MLTAALTACGSENSSPDDTGTNSEAGGEESSDDDHSVLPSDDRADYEGLYMWSPDREGRPYAHSRPTHDDTGYSNNPEYVEAYGWKEDNGDRRPQTPPELPIDDTRLEGPYLINDVVDTNVVVLEKINKEPKDYGTTGYSRTGDITQFRMLGTQSIPKSSKLHDKAVESIKDDLDVSDHHLELLKLYEEDPEHTNEPNIPLVYIETDPNRPETNSEGQLQGYLFDSPTSLVNSRTIGLGYNYFYMDPEKEPLKYVQRLYSSEEVAAMETKLVFAAEFLQSRDGESRH